MGSNVWRDDGVKAETIGMKQTQSRMWQVTRFGCRNEESACTLTDIGWQMKDYTKNALLNVLCADNR